MKSQTIQIISNITAFIIILAAAISYLFFQHDQIQRPYILITGACFAALNSKNSQIKLLQNLTIFYLFMILTQPLTSKYILVPLGIAKISIPLSLVILLVIAILHALSKMLCRINFPNQDSENISLIITTSIILISAHMFVLFLMLKKFYGYGYEYNFAVLGKLIFVALMFLFTYEIFEKTKFRQLSSFVFAIVFMILTFKGLPL